VADVLYSAGENAPNSMPTSGPTLPPGYDYDGIGAGAIMRLLSVRDGRLVTPSGMSYRVLVLPPGQTMTPAMLRKIRSLVQAGATIIAEKPTRSPSLQNFPAADREVQVLAEEIWGNCDGKAVTSHQLGRGRIVWGQSAEQVLASMQAAPDFSFADKSARLAYIHRSIGTGSGAGDMYFVSNQRKVSQQIECSFRVSGRAPELWHADTGQIEPATLYREENGRTFVTLDMDANDSVFVIFRRPAPREHLASATFAALNVDTKPQPKLEIQSAKYEAADGFASVDVTEKVRARLEGNTVTMVADNAVFGDPANLHVKRLRVEYTLDGAPKTALVPEGSTLELNLPPSVPAPFTWKQDSRGRAQVLAWQAGTLQVRSARGKSQRLKLAAPLPAQEIDGPWQVSFPPNWGAPAQVRLDKLASWSENADSGVKYFSGTATYAKQFSLSPAQLGASQVLELDLGDVRDIARVKLNGVDLGTLWKPPFRVGITRAAKVGANRLEVAVTNSWPNRLIGDEQLPDDREWNGMQLKQWPDWVLQGKPSPTGRYTFTTWHHWRKDSPLLDAGLLGPVTVRSGRLVPVR
jgi:hypothetical protein